MTYQLSQYVVLVAMLAFVTDAFARTHASVPDIAVVLRVRVENQARVPPWLLGVAEKRAAEVFGRIGVSTEWIDGQEAARENHMVPYTILLMARQVAERKAAAEGLEDGVVGQTAPLTGRAFVYYDRVGAMVTPSRDVVSLLGDVIAHELGHLLLSSGHSPKGIMRPHIEMSTRRIETFTAAQASAIWRRLAVVGTIRR